ncbi:MAG: tRNA uridine-5-carboxymethylaminomethyl(34) synthesis enzyme MnmG [Clostridia bacterium]|nr:tRNA uridine-5-carboxymethylaminomethyl(34) synthesis enzyme MnmG [Clostridia bacterium]
MQKTADIAIIGAGHAGVEAALASARLGLSTVLFTLSLDAIANMPCNPSIGGTAKGHLVYEIDALGGEMGRAADAVTLQSRTLNTGKGAAVRSKRVQADRLLYRSYMKNCVENTDNLITVQEEIVDIKTCADENGKKQIKSVVTSLGNEWEIRAAVICAGTYLGGKTFVGDCVREAGPDSQLPANALTEALVREGITVRRFKTGTPQRVDARSIDFSRLEIQEGEHSPLPFSYSTEKTAYERLESVPCHIVYTNAKTHEIIKNNIHRSAMYSGKIHGVGPRYCPSIEDKIVRFADKERHQLFVEPTGRDTNEMYLQGFSTSLPADVQEEMIRTLDGFENAKIMRYAYAIEYDCADSTELLPTLEFKAIGGLYGAGQFNGTSGYEEAAAQGLVAGANAALKILGKDPLVLTRSSSYIGTLIDDLVTKGTNEPYRMMTSRSEFRLLLRQDNADMRLTPIAHSLGLVSEEQYKVFSERRERVENEIERLKKTTVPPTEELNNLLISLGSTPISTGIKLAELLRRPQVDMSHIRMIDKNAPELSLRDTESVETAVKYEGYIKKQNDEANRQKKLENMSLSADTDYKSISGLRIEAAEKLNKIKPANIGQASRISGVNPADISVLIIRFKQDKGE